MKYGIDAWDRHRPRLYQHALMLMAIAIVALIAVSLYIAWYNPDPFTRHTILTIEVLILIAYVVYFSTREEYSTPWPFRSLELWYRIHIRGLLGIAHLERPNLQRLNGCNHFQRQVIGNYTATLSPKNRTDVFSVREADPQLPIAIAIALGGIRRYSNLIINIDGKQTRWRHSLVLTVKWMKKTQINSVRVHDDAGNCIVFDMQELLLRANHYYFTKGHAPTRVKNLLESTPDTGDLLAAMEEHKKKNRDRIKAID